MFSLCSGIDRLQLNKFSFVKTLEKTMYAGRGYSEVHASTRRHSPRLQPLGGISLFCINRGSENVSHEAHCLLSARLKLTQTDRQWIPMLGMTILGHVVQHIYPGSHKMHSHFPFRHPLCRHQTLGRYPSPSKG